MIWIFTEGGGDVIEARLPFKIFSTLKTINVGIIKNQIQFQDIFDPLVKTK